MMSAAFALIRRDLKVSFRDGVGPWTVLGFFIIAVILFPLGIGPEPKLLTRIGSGVIWSMALLSALLSFDTLFESDYHDGSLDMLLTGRLTPEVLILTKTIAHWLTTGLPLTCLAPVLSIVLYIPDDASTTLTLSLLLGTPVLSLLGSVGAALSLGARHGTVLVAIIILPLAAPVLIFGAGAVEMTMTGLDNGSSLLILGGISIGAAAICPIAAAAAIRQAVE